MENCKDDVEAVQRISVIPSLLEVVCRTTGMGFAAVARVTEDRWIACSVRDEISFGLVPGSELTIETTICNEIRHSGEPVIIDEVNADEKFCHHPTPAMYGFQSYISVPITRRDGNFFGTLCAIDPRPARLSNPETVGMFRLFADLISFHLEVVDKLASTETSLQEERKTAELREQFIAILGHDLRNPVGAISSSAQLMQRMVIDEELMKLVNVIKSSSFRILGLIENILDFARGRLGEGIVLKREEHCDVVNMLNQVITELRAVWPDRIIQTTFDLPAPVNCDSARIAQLFSNLLSNALSYGREDKPIQVEASTRDGRFILSVANIGIPISPTAMRRLFTAFSRSELKPGQQGLGLGLYIAREIARAHGGDVSVSSTEKETRFTLDIPST